MDKLKECINQFNNLLDKDFYYTFDNGMTIKFYFAKKHFHHLIGLHKLKDIREVRISKRKTSTYIYNYINKGNLKYSDIESSMYFDKIKDRIDNFNSINDILLERSIVHFDKTKFPYDTSLKSNILFLKSDNGYLHLCLAKDGSIYYPESFFVRHNNDYVKNQNVLNIKEMKVCISRKSIILDHRIYTDPSQQTLDEVAITKFT